MSQRIIDLIEYYSAGETIAVNDAIYVDPTDGKIYKLDVTDPDKRAFSGIAKTSGILDASIKVVQAGKLKGFSGLIPGQAVYASNVTAGGFTTDKPTNVAETVILGTAKNATDLILNPSLSVPFSSGDGSGGVGGVDILAVQDFDAQDLGEFTHVGLTFETVAPLKGEASAKLTHDDTINQSFKQVIPVDRKFRGKGVTLKLNIKSAALAGNVVLNVVDETNTITLVNSEQLPVSDVVSGTVGIASFMMPDDCASFSYEVIALPEVGTPVTLVDDVLIELSTSSLLATSIEVPIVTELQPYTPTFEGLGTVTNVYARYRRNGQNIEVYGRVTVGTVTGVSAKIGLPSGLLLDQTNVPAGSLVTVGKAARGNSTADQFHMTTGNGETNKVLFARMSFGGLTALSGSALIANGDSISFSFSVPIQGLTATKAQTVPLAQSVLVNESDSVLYAAGNAGQAITANVTDIPFNLVSNKGDDIVWNGASFNVTEDGIYQLQAQIAFTTSSPRGVDLYEDGLKKRTLDFTSVSPHSATFIGELQIGKNYSIRTETNGGTLNNNLLWHHISITKQNSIKQVNVNPNSKITIPTSELRMEGASSRGSVDTAIVRFTSVAKLRGDAFEVISTVENGTKIVMKKKGKLDISMSLVPSNGTVRISRNQQALTTLPTVQETLANESGVGTAVSMSADLFVDIGDILRVASDTAINSSANSLNLSFQEQDIAVSVTNVLPQFSDSDSSIRLDTANGYGSTFTRVRRFSNVRDNIGNDVEYVPSAVNGDRFLVKSSGLYTLSYSETFDVATDFCIAKNVTDPALTVNNVPLEQRLGFSTTAAINHGYNIATEAYLNKGDFVVGLSNGNNAGSSPSRVMFTISKVGKPNVTGIDVTPFVNIPQPDSQSQRHFIASIVANGIAIAAPITTSRGSGIYSYASNGIFTALKPCDVNLSASHRSSGAGLYGTPSIYVNGVIVGEDISAGIDEFSASASWSGSLNAGDTFEFRAATGAAQKNVRLAVLATATSDQIITPPEVFSTDTNNLTYAGSGLYTLSTLANAPVGTFITFTYAASTNTRTQTTTAPTQTTADMNLNGMRIFTRAYNAASTAAEPAIFAIQVGKGFKGQTLDLYKSAGKVTSGALEYFQISTFSEGIRIRTYNENTGVLILDAGFQGTVVTSGASLTFSDVSNQNNGYLVINASKSPLKMGFGIASDTSAKLGLDPDKFITPKTLRSGFNATGEAPVYACRAWVNFNGTGTVAIRASGNVSSVTDLGTGFYQVNFETPMQDTNYAITQGPADIGDGSGNLQLNAMSDSSFVVRTRYAPGGDYDWVRVLLTVFR